MKIMQFFRMINIRIISFFDMGLFVITGSVYARTLSALSRNNMHNIKFSYAAASAVPVVLLLVIGLLCIAGRRNGLIAAMLLSSLMLILAITGMGIGGVILIFLDGSESGVNSRLDAVYYSSLFLIGGGFMLMLYMLLHIRMLYTAVADMTPQV